MAETDLHRELMFALIKILEAWYAQDPLVYVSGNLLVYYVPGDRRRHLSPDVFVIKGVSKRRRDNYLIWEEGKSLDVVIELTSASTRDEDVEDKMWLYRDVLKVPEYFLFDPHGDYLSPPLQGYRLNQGEYVPIEPVAGRLPSAVLGLHLERQGSVLRLYNPATGQWMLTPDEKVAQETAARQQAEQSLQLSEEARRQAEAEIERLRREIEELRRGPAQP
jgi:Uma2 family endonuclease